MIVNPKAFGQSGVGHSSLWPISYLRNLCLKVTICHPQPTNPPGNPNPPVSPFSTKAQPVPPSTHNAWQHEPTWNFERRRARVNVPFWELDGEGWLGGELSRRPYLLEFAGWMNVSSIFWGVSTPSKNKVFWPIKTGISFGFRSRYTQGTNDSFVDGQVGREVIYVHWDYEFSSSFQQYSDLRL